MRLAAKEKGGWYPTPSRSLFAIVQLLRTGATEGIVRALDPCAGEGDALNELCWTLRSTRPATNGTAPAVQIIPYAVEPAPRRYEKCLDRFGRDQTIKAHWEETTVANASFSILWLNPPYDWDAVEQDEQEQLENNESTSSRKNRLEYNFLRETYQKLQPGGVLVFILPHRILGTERVARTLSSNFSDIRVFSFPDGPEDYDRFKQCVLFAYRRESSTEDEETTKLLMTFGSERPPTLYQINPDAKPIYTVPAAILPQNKMIFRQTVLTYDETAQLVYSEGASFSQDWQRLRNPPPVNFRPVIRLRTGHIGPLVSSGQLKTVNLGDMLVRGAAAKEIVAQDEYGQMVEQHSKTCKTWTERFTTQIYCLDRYGKYSIIDKPGDLRVLLDNYGPLLHEIVQDRYPPLYTGPTAAEWQVLGTLMKRKKLPGRQEAGLLTAQKHVVAAICRVLKEKHAAIIVGEMGTGKGPMQLAAIELLNAYPAAIATPAHMLEKFYREALDTIPNAKPVIVSTTADLDKLRKAYKPGDKLIVIASYEAWKEGPGWEPQAMRGSKVVDIKDPDTGIITGRKRVRIWRCPKCGAEAPASLMKSDKPLRCTGKKVLYDAKGEPVFKVCGEKLMQFKTLKKWPLARYVHTHMPHFFRMFVADEIHKTKSKGANIAQAFQLMVKSVDYVLGGTGTLFGGKSTDLFFMLYRINVEIRKRFGFNNESAWSATYGRQQMILADDGDDHSKTTGSRRRVARVKELAGISPAVYAWVFEQVVFLKVSELGFEMPPYAEQIERMLMSEVQKQQYEWLYSTLYEEIKRGITSFSSRGMKEAMALMSVFLQNCLSRPMSGFRTERIFWKPPEGKGHKPYRVPRGQSKQFGYTDRDDALIIHNLTDTDSDVEEKNPQDQRGLFDDPEIDGEASEKEKLKTEPMDLFPVNRLGELLPKEQWLLSAIRNEIAEGRTVLLYVRQTGKRNIQPRLADILNRAGIRTVILPDGNARTREAWIQQHTRFAQVLITNPKKVETGLDLIMFSTVIFYELDYSLFTMWQAMRRVWRLGQTKAVKVIIPIHSDAMEEHALNIMANKFQAALLLYGEAGAGLAQEADVQDVMAELTRHILEGQILSANGIDSLMAQSIQAEMEGAEATETMPSAEELAALFAELAAGDGDELDEDGDVIDGEYSLLPDGAEAFTSMADEPDANLLPIFAAMAAMTQMAEETAAEETETAELAMAAAADDDRCSRCYSPRQRHPQKHRPQRPRKQHLQPPPKPLRSPRRNLRLHRNLSPVPALPVYAFKPGDRVRMPSGLIGIILTIEDGYMADVAVTGTRFCALAPLSDLVLEPKQAQPAAAAPAAQPQAAPAPKVAPAAPAAPGKTTPTLWDFWNFQKQTDAATGVTSITVSPKDDAKKKKGKGDAPEQLDIFTTFLTTEPTFTEQAKPS